MKIREIILDFTSLLDVMMLILFFFILFSHFEVEEAKENASQVMEEANAISESAEVKLQQAEEELSVLQNIDPNRAADAAALRELSRGTLVQSWLDVDNSGETWTLTLKRKDDETQIERQIAKINSQDNISSELIQVLSAENYIPDDKIPFLFFYDGTEPGSAEAFQEMDTAFYEVRKTYPHFYVAELDISDFSLQEEFINE